MASVYCYAEEGGHATKNNSSETPVSRLLTTRTIAVIFIRNNSDC